MENLFVWKIKSPRTFLKCPDCEFKFPRKLANFATREIKFPRKFLHLKYYNHILQLTKYKQNVSTTPKIITDIITDMG